MRGGGRRGGHRGLRAEGLQDSVGDGARAGKWGGGRGGRRRDAAAHAAVAAGFGTALGQSLRGSHSSQHPRRANKALLMGGQQRGSGGRRPLLRGRWGRMWLHLATNAHHQARPVIGRCHGNKPLSLGRGLGLAHGARCFNQAEGTNCSPGSQREAGCLHTSEGGDGRRR